MKGQLRGGELIPHRLTYIQLVGIIGLIAFAMVGCGSALSGAASMQVEVEVYNGPLSKEPVAQWGELLGIMEQTRDILWFTEKQLKLVMLTSVGYQDFEEKDWEDCWVAPRNAEGKIDKMNPVLQEVCTRVVAMGQFTRNAGKQMNDQLLEAQACSDDLDTSLRKDGLSSITDTEASKLRGCFQSVLTKASKLASSLTVSAFVVTESHVPFASPMRKIRTMQVSFANLAAELSNQIGSRADSLLKQMGGEKREVLPVSVYLRDASQTDFLNLFVWNYAGAPSLCEEGCLGEEEVTRNRVRAVESLFTNDNWAKINSVYASGKGDVRMAFIKDDLGNWNLKSFDNDATDLLKAYKDAGLAALKSVERLAATVAAPGVYQAQSALNFANQLALGQGSSDAAAADVKTISALHRRTLDQLEALKTKVGDRGKALPGEIETAQKDLNEKQDAIKTFDLQLEAEKSKRPASTPAALQMDLKIRKGRIEEAEADIAAIDAEIARLGDAEPQKVEALNMRRQQKEKDLNGHRDKINMIEADISTHEAINQKIQSIEAQRKPAADELRALQAKLKGLEAERDQLSKHSFEAVRQLLNQHSEMLDVFLELSAAPTDKEADTSTVPKPQGSG